MGGAEHTDHVLVGAELEGADRLAPRLVHLWGIADGRVGCEHGALHQRWGVRGLGGGWTCGLRRFAEGYICLLGGGSVRCEM